MANVPSILDKEFNNHTLPNVVDDIKVDSLSESAYRVHTQPVRRQSITLQVIDEKTHEVIDTIVGQASSGNLRISSTSLIRRTADFKMIVSKTTYPNPDSLLWFNKYIKMYAGIIDNANGEEINFLLGTFWIDKISYEKSASSYELTVTLADKMLKYNDNQLVDKTEIAIGTPIHIAMRKAMEKAGETKFGFVEPSLENEVVPYTLKFGQVDQFTKLITTLRDMYMEFGCGYNIKGEFEFRKYPMQLDAQTDRPKWEFTSQNVGFDTIISFKEDYDLTNIKNKYIVYGNISEVTGIAPIGEARVTDAKSPFNVYAIGERIKVVQEQKYVTNEQCIAKAKYEVLKSSNFQEKVTIETVPIYFLDVNDVITVEHPETHKIEKYAMDSINTTLSVEGTMKIEAHKLYFVTLEYGEEKNPLVNAISRGITNLGWLSLSEARIRDCYGILGSGEATLTVRFQDNIDGGEQASVTSYATTKNQTLMIDLADFAELDLKDENGAASNRSEGDFADRVLGHEMFHATLNDYIGHDNAIQVPTYINEGFAEFIHGAKERFQSVYTDMTKADKRKKLTEICEKLINNGAFVGDSEHYVASYLSVVAIYELCTKEQWLRLWPSMRGKSSIGINFLYKFLPIASTPEEVQRKVIEKVKTMDKVWNFLFDIDDKDTGSVGGIHFMNIYGVPLTARTVFNNADATVASLGFNVQIVK